MKIVQVKISNFRGYKDETTINFNELTVFVGKNDKKIKYAENDNG